MKLSIRKINALSDIPASEWNTLVNHRNPFLRHEFLAGLERYKCLEGHGWYPAHILAYTDQKLTGALPLYFKTNSIGEFVFDWNWAEAYEKAGGNYYPKLVSAIPFTPVTGHKCLTGDSNLTEENPETKEHIRKQLYAAARELTEETGVSGLHYLFPEEGECRELCNEGLLIRKGCQYHWFNHDYRDFDDFLENLNSKRRKQINRERRSVREGDIEIEILQGSEITPEHWEIYYQFYVSTFERKWGDPRLTLPFFEALSRTMSDAALLFLAQHRNKYVAGAFAMRGTDTLYGRHWGCERQFHFLHFELCYYQTIDYCIRHGLKKLDAGAQGEHKINRGFIPVSTWSAHWIANIEFRNAIAGFLEHEQLYIENYMNALSAHLAYRSG